MNIHRSAEFTKKRMLLMKKKCPWCLKLLSDCPKKLKVSGVDTFCSRNTYYRRAYDILHELDKRVLEELEAGEFSSWIDIEYKEGGWAFFEFSHFEVDLREPDSQYRTLYVVYRYDTTAS